MMSIEISELNALNEALGVTVLRPGDNYYPAGVTGTLYARGDVSLLANLDTNGVTVSGARASTGYGEHVTMELVTGLVQRGLTIVTGAGYGVEGMALRAALANESKPVVVLAGGVDRYYPSGHDTLLARVLEAGGVIASLAETGSSPTKWRFLEAGTLKGQLSAATVITEAGWRSGSIGVAVAAYKAGRKVYAVPGPVTSANSAGVHQLIRDRIASLATHAKDIEL